MKPTEQLTAILPALSDVVDRLEPAQLHNATPCTTFVLRDVLDHMITGAGSFAYMFRGEQPPPSGPRTDDGLVPAAEFRRAMDELLDAVHADGAMQRTIASPFGAMPGDTLARLVAFDGLVHGWDIARASGLSWEVADDVVANVDAFARMAVSEDLRDGDTFKDPTTPDDTATPIERVAAFSGRTI